MNPCPHCGKQLSEHTVEDGCLNAWVATLLGWTNVDFSKRCDFWLGHAPGQSLPDRVPHYTTSIAAAYALEESLPEELREKYVYHLWRAVPMPQNRLMPKSVAEWYLLHASPLDRTRAFIAAMSEREDDGE